MTAQTICKNIFKTPFSISRIPTGKFNESYYISTDKEEYVLRIAPADSTDVLFYEYKMMHKEPEIHRIVGEKTTIPIPLIIDYDFSRSIVDRDWLLMERIPGNPLSEAYGNSITLSKMFFNLGRFIKELHLIRGSKFGYKKSKFTGPMQDSWYAAFKGIWNNLLNDIVKTGIYSLKNAKELSELLDYHSSAFNHITRSSLLHMDVWTQNILVDREGVITGIIDWDRSLWGDPEIEYAVLEYCGTSPPMFWEGYGSKPLQDSDYKIRRMFYILYEHQKYIFIRAMRNKNIISARRYAEESLKLARELK